MVNGIDCIASLFEEANRNLIQYRAVLATRDWAAIKFEGQAKGLEDILIRQLDQIAILDVSAQFFTALAAGNLAKAADLQKILLRAKEVGISVDRNDTLGQCPDESIAFASSQ